MDNFESMCRTCSYTGELQSLFGDKHMIIAEMLNEMVDLKVIKEFPTNFDIKELEIDSKESSVLLIHQESGALESDCKDEAENISLEQEFYKDKHEEIQRRKQHLRSHTKEKPFECEICGAKFSSRWNCLRHTKLHSGNKSYACDMCDRKFYEKYELAAHKSSHSTEKPFKCELCTKRYKRKSHLDMHIAYVHEKSKKYAQKMNDKKRHLCNHCGKTFSIKPQLDRHELIHMGIKPFKCNQCSLSFRQKSHLQTHHLTHTGEKRYQCSVCAKKFAANGNLTIHMRIHTGETPYVCSICKKGFYDSSSLKKHITNH
ncbi:zinc finger protein 525-like [Chrysoperla carnea]|uniref:zinc finger protein 525-like n=1 Tax=Chrysoperla carnea TaxID=189513 RepID=UPI001D0648A6|nr:zinc finger protein 525-like [Chrysoperla carnea]